MHSSNRIQGTRLVVVARLVGSHELCSHCHQLLGLIFDVLPVVVVRPLNELDVVAARSLFIPRIGD